MTTYRVGDLVSIEFPFSDLNTKKRRPGLVLLSNSMDVVVARITTHPPRDPSDIVIHHWAHIGLPRASTIRLTKLATIDQRLVHHLIGHLHQEDSQAVANTWQQISASIVTALQT